MAAFKPIDPHGLSDRELILASIRQGEQLHGCLESHVAETRQRAEQSARERAEIRKDMVGMKINLARVEDRQKIDGARITRLAQIFGAEAVQKGQKPPKGRSIATWPGWKLFGAVAGAIALFTFCYQLGAALVPDLARDFHHFMMERKP